MHPKWFCMIGAGVVLTTAAFAQETDSSALSVRRIFGTREFSPGRVGEVRWLDDGDAYTTVERSVSVRGGRDIVRYETATGARSILVPAERLRSAGDSITLNPENYEWSPDRKFLLLYTNSKRVWRTRSRGDYWILRLADWSLWKVGGEAKPSTLMFAKFSPAGDMLGYVCGGDYCADGRRITDVD
jgi:dipeptidyl-peptidase-4